jgi:hypothetical protein
MDPGTDEPTDELADELADALQEIERLRSGIARLSKTRPKECIFPPLPPCTPSTTPPTLSNPTATAAHAKCLQALAHMRQGYQHAQHNRQRKNRHNVTLTSAFDIQRVTLCPHKIKVDATLAQRALEIFGRSFVEQQFQQHPNLIVLLLDAPNIATTTALLQAFPLLPSHRIVIPQADPQHYSCMINHATIGTGTTTTTTTTTPPLPNTLHLNVRCQRLDQWLVSNTKTMLQCPVFFADYETSVYGKPSYNFEPLVDLQRFIRCGYVARSTGTLMGVTLSFRVPGQHVYAKDQPPIVAEDVIGFVQHEASMAQLHANVLDVINYGMTFLLFHLTDVRHANSSTTTSSNSSSSDSSNSDTTTTTTTTTTRDYLQRLPNHLRAKVLSFFGYKEYTLVGRTCHYLHALWKEATDNKRLPLYVPVDCQTLGEAVRRVHEEDRLTTIVVGKGEHQIDGYGNYLRRSHLRRFDGSYLEISSAMNIVGDPGVLKSEIVVVGGIAFKKGIPGNCHLQHLTLRQRQAKTNGVLGWSSFTMEDVLLEQCGHGVFASGTGVTGRCTNVEVRQCCWSGVVAAEGAFITLIGAKTTVHHNCTDGDSDDYGLNVFGSSSSTIQLVSPLTKEQASIDNGGGGNWGANHGADINQIKTIGDAKSNGSTCRRGGVVQHLF